MEISGISVSFEVVEEEVGTETLSIVLGTATFTFGMFIPSLTCSSEVLGRISVEFPEFPEFLEFPEFSEIVDVVEVDIGTEELPIVDVATFAPSKVI